MWKYIIMNYFMIILCRTPIPTDDTSLASWVPYTVEGADYYKLDVVTEAKKDYTASWRCGFKTTCP